MQLKSLKTLVIRAIKDITHPNRFGVSSDLLDLEKMPYGLDYSIFGMEKAYGMDFDNQGIIMMLHYYDHLEKYETKSRHYYSPVKIAHYAVAAYNDYLKTGKEEYKSKCLKHVDFLMANITLINNCTVWSTPSSNPKYELEPNYISAIVQGLVISALCRGYKLNGNEEYLNTAEKALSILSIPVEDGGLSASTKWGTVYEEYPSIPYSHVINGFMFCLMGIYDISLLRSGKGYGQMFNQGINCLIALIPSWIQSDWTKYDLRDIYGKVKMNYATRHYQFLHIDQLEILYQYSGEEKLQKAAKEIESQVSSIRATIKMYLNKYLYLLKV